MKSRKEKEIKMMCEEEIKDMTGFAYYLRRTDPELGKLQGKDAFIEGFVLGRIFTIEQLWPSDEVLEKEELPELLQKYVKYSKLMEQHG